MKPVLSEAQLKRLKEYKFKAEGASLLDINVLKVFWGYLVEHIPMWVAPNVISFLGLAALVITTFPLFLYCPTATEEVPWWFYTNSVIGLFLIQTLDAVDGLQARRTGNGSPIGAIVDSACDIVAFGIGVTSCSVAMQLGTSPEWMFYFHLLCFSIDYAEYWKNCFLDVLYYNLIESNEYLAMMMTIHAVSAMFGPATWSTQGSSHLCTACPLLIFLMLALATKGASAHQTYPTLYYLMFGLAHAKITIVLRVADATKSKMPLIDPSMLGPAMLLLSSFLGDYVSEYFVLCMALMLVGLDLVVYSTLFLRESCDYLNISCFKVKDKS
ncbi:CEPT1 [Branchiostoma lanceolatum]|uniref:CEPT1 protein n=1 Tax=Branchiostoma lanceolatum TaxID=7740 RepID=A0A8J9YYY8_BRALA|nr:CEPT1 [Branchiostoma lanceolatum]